MLLKNAPILVISEVLTSHLRKIVIAELNQLKCELSWFNNGQIKSAEVLISHLCKIVNKKQST